MNKKGFTLIEIMIVIVIISLLAVTLVPKLTGAQARSRDASRTSSLLSMKTVLITYFDDYSEFPVNTHDDIKNTATNGDGCLSSNAKGGADVLADYLEGGKASFDPQKNAKVLGCATAGSFGYTALMKNGSNNSAFILSAQTETYQKSNTITVSALTDTDNDGGYDIDSLATTNYLFEQEIGALKDADEESATKTIYTVTGG